MFRYVSLSFLIVFLMAATLTGIARAQEFQDMQATYLFGDQITFQARFLSEIPAQTAMISFQATNDPHTNVGLASVEMLEQGVYEVTYVHKLADYSLQAFSYVTYHFEVTLEGGEIVKSLPMEFYYEDNRFAWQERQEGPFRVHWYEGDIQFAQLVLDTAQGGLMRIQNLLPSLPAPVLLDIYVYDNASALQDTLHPSSGNWVAGHADPALGVVVVSLPSGMEQRLLTEQRIPHELMHIMLYQATSLGYANLPAWLNEGLASMAELYPNSDYNILLDDAVQRDGLLPMNSLCNTFPRDAAGALLSYAQSYSFTNYLRDTYGTTGLQRLITNYANGLDCENGAQAALDRSLSQLEREWRRDELAENVVLSALNNLLPWFVLLFAALAAQIGLFIHRLRARNIEQASNSQAS
ncbi:MAG: hypothetical protein JXA78_06850 [Anaerolineales bacterium]|nr:hypothetical protein [Anaerolineales bacterium]